MLSGTLKNAPHKSTTVNCVASGDPAHQLENWPLLHLLLLSHVQGDRNHLAFSQAIEVCFSEDSELSPKHLLATVL